MSASIGSYPSATRAKDDIEQPAENTSTAQQATFQEAEKRQPWLQFYQFPKTPQQGFEWRNEDEIRIIDEERDSM